MYAQTAVKSHILHRNGTSPIVMRGVQKCTGAGASLRDRNVLPLCCINLDTVTDVACRSGGMFINATLRLIYLYSNTFAPQIKDAINTDCSYIIRF